MKHINLDDEIESIKTFIRSLLRDEEGSILELEGKPVVKIIPISTPKVDKKKLKEAIVRRRDASRKLNQDWTHADQEAWNQNDAEV